MKDNEWALLLLDNCSCHYSEEVIKSLFSKKIVIGYFPPNATHVISPLDLTVFEESKSN